jgi:UDP-glucose 4-epimerase
MIKNKKIFITGGAGFIANKILDSVLDENKVTVFDNFTRDTLSASSANNHRNLTVIKGDVRDLDALIEGMRGSEIVVHCAGIAGIDTVIKSPVKTMTVNMIGTANVLAAALECRVSDRVLDFSTSEVFGSMAFRSAEADPTVSGSAGEARWTYAVSKLAGEHLAHAYFSEHQLPVVTVRPFNVYGPGQTGEGAMSGFIKKALKNEPIQIHGDGNQIRAWCYVDDFVNCIIKCIENPGAIGQSFNVGNSRAVITILGLAHMVCRVLNSKSTITHVDELSADIAIRIPSVQKSKDVLDFSAMVDLEEGILLMANWIKETHYDG